MSVVTFVMWAVLIFLACLWIKEYKDGCFLEFAIKQQLKGYPVNVLDISELGKTQAEIELSNIEIDASKMRFSIKWRKINNTIIVVWTNWRNKNAD